MSDQKKTEMNNVKQYIDDEYSETSEAVNVEATDAQPADAYDDDDDDDEEENVASGEPQSNANLKDAVGKRRVILGKKLWTQAEDDRLKELVKEKGPRDWPWISSKMEGRTSKQCSKRWNYKLSPFIRHEKQWTPEEDKIILTVQKKMGNRWSSIAKLLVGRSDLGVKNRFYTLERQRVHAEKHFKSIEDIDELKNDIEKLKSAAYNNHKTPVEVENPKDNVTSSSGAIKTGLVVSSDSHEAYVFDMSPSYMGGYPSYPITPAYMMPYPQYGYPQQMMYSNSYMHPQGSMSSATAGPQGYHMFVPYGASSFSGMPSYEGMSHMPSQSYYRIPPPQALFDNSIAASSLIALGNRTSASTTADENTRKRCRDENHAEKSEGIYDDFRPPSLHLVSKDLN